MAYKIKQLESPSIILRQHDYCSSKHCYNWWIHLNFVKHIARSCGRIVLTIEVKILWFIHILVRNMWLSVKTSVLKSFWGWIRCGTPITLGIALGNQISIITVSLQLDGSNWEHRWPSIETTESGLIITWSNTMWYCIQQGNDEVGR